MNSRIDDDFRAALARLPEPIRRQARAAYRRFLQNPRHPSLRFKRVHQVLPVYSARINLNYRAAGTLDSDTITWFFIGTHDEYERMLANL